MIITNTQNTKKGLTDLKKLVNKTLFKEIKKTTKLNKINQFIIEIKRNNLLVDLYINDGYNVYFSYNCSTQEYYKEYYELLPFDYEN